MPERVASTSEIADGQMKAFDVGGTTVAVANVGGTFYAFDDECTHAACSLAGGMLEGRNVECPCHGSMFDVSDGSVQNPPATEPVKSYAVTVDGDAIMIDI